MQVKASSNEGLWYEIHGFVRQHMDSTYVHRVRAVQNQTKALALPTEADIVPPCCVCELPR